VCSIRPLNDGTKRYNLIVCRENFDELQDLRESLGMGREKWEKCSEGEG